MKKCFLGIILMMAGFHITLAQNFAIYQNIKFDRPEQYKEHQQMAHEAAKYVLTTPHSNEDEERMHAARFMLKWMEGTPDYNFDILPWMAGLNRTDRFLYPVTMAALVKAALDDTQKEKDANALQVATAEEVAKYMANKEHKLRPRSTGKKFVQAWEEGRLEEFLELPEE
ncbi:MAG: hypothetical protein ACFCUU_00150 [Cyclobacteriaceae bacterium]